MVRTHFLLTTTRKTACTKLSNNYRAALQQAQERASEHATCVTVKASARQFLQRRVLTLTFENGCVKQVKDEFMRSALLASQQREGKTPTRPFHPYLTKCSALPRNYIKVYFCASQRTEDNYVFADSSCPKTSTTGACVPCFRNVPFKLYSIVLW